jgi:pyrroloquinoline quinone biosynthesis protein E
MGGWARDAFMVTPDGTVLPCHAAQTITHLHFERFGERSLSEIWADSPGFNAFRGTDWMQEPCRSCERREIDWGGCRCQAMAIAGDAAAADPACVKSPIHARMAALIEAAQMEAAGAEGKKAADFTWRRIGTATEPAQPTAARSKPTLEPSVSR